MKTLFNFSISQKRKTLFRSIDNLGMGTSEAEERKKTQDTTNTILRNFDKKNLTSKQKEVLAKKKLAPYGQSMAKKLTPEKAFEYGAIMKKKSDKIEKSAKNIECGYFNIHGYEVPISNLPEEFDGMSILQLSDIHFDYREPKETKRIISSLKLLVFKMPKPDLIVITGDFIEKTPHDLTGEILDCLKNIFPGVPKYFTLGNHEYEENNDPKNNIIPSLESAGYQNLTNKTKRISRKNSHINIIGVDDFLGGNPIPPKLNEKEINLVFTHELDAINNDFPMGIDLICSGHLHSGEIDLGVFNGNDILKYQGVFKDINDQTESWKMLNARTASHINSGIATKNILSTRIFTKDSGVSLLTLRKFSD